MSRIALLGTGLIGRFYVDALQGRRSQDRVEIVYSRSADRAESFAASHGIARWTTDMQAAITDAEAEVVIVGLPNHLHEAAVTAAARAGKAVLCTKPLGRNAAEALRMLRLVESEGVFHGYLEDLVYTPKTLKAAAEVRNGLLGRVLWARSRETHPGPHSDWFFDRDLSGGGAIIDMGCHCIEIARTFIGKNDRPVEVVCWGDTQVHPIDVEDHAVGLVRYGSGAIGQFEVSWTFRGGMDLRDEVSGTDGTIWLNHWLRTGMEVFSATGTSAYVAEKAESSGGWLFPVGDETASLGYVEMFTDMLDSRDKQVSPRETFYDGYVVNAIIDSAYRSMSSKQWEPIELEVWRGSDSNVVVETKQDFDDDHWLIKRELMPDGNHKVMLRHKLSGKLSQRIE